MLMCVGILLIIQQRFFDCICPESINALEKPYGSPGFAVICISITEIPRGPALDSVELMSRMVKSCHDRTNRDRGWAGWE
jgi:hypothetical protein